MRFTFLRLAPLWAIFSASGPLHAAASLLVDDAGTTPDGTCQLESWSRRHADVIELTAVPACTLANIEWSLGLSHLRGAGAAPWSLGGKRTLHGWIENRVQLAASIETIGDVRHGGARGWAANVPLSLAVDRQGNLLAHLNAGWNRSRDERGMTLGVGSELRLVSGWSLLAEHWRDAARHHGSQVGVRRHLLNDASVDVLAGRHHGTDAAAWIGVGLNVPLHTR